MIRKSGPKSWFTKKRKKFEKTITLGLDPVSSSQPRIKKLHLVKEPRDLSE